MCIQIKTIFRCNCPHQNTQLCPHHIYIRETQDQIDKTTERKYADNGFQLRPKSALQAHKDWTPLRQDDELVAAYAKWEHCSVYKARNQTEPGDIKSGKESSCANWIQNQESFSRLVRGLCPECIDGHGVPKPKPSPIRGRFIENIGVDTEVDAKTSVTVKVVKTENGNETRPSTPTNLKGKRLSLSQQSPLRKILSQARQKVIRRSLGAASGECDSDSRASTPVSTVGGSPDQNLRRSSASPGKEKCKGKELPDVFGRLLLGTGSVPKRDRANSGAKSPSSVKRPVSRQTRGTVKGGK
ncbi:hypothetical protein V8F20_009041 [Naviculisporaceae sp. PSN 640]